MPTAQPSGSSRRIGPLPLWAWALCGIGGFLGYRWWSNYEASKTAASTTTTSTTTPASSSGTTTTTYSDLGSWEQAAITQLTSQGMTGADALNGITSWLNGTCVSSGVYQQLSQLITTVGLPPGYSSANLPTLSVCSSSEVTEGTPVTPLVTTSASPVGETYEQVPTSTNVQPGGYYQPAATPAPDTVLVGAVPGEPGYTGSGNTITTPGPAGDITRTM